MTTPWSLEAPLVRLRDWCEADLARWNYWLQPGHRWKELDGPYYALPTPVEIASMLAKIHDQIQEGSWPIPRQRAVICQPNDAAFLGLVSWYWESQETQWPGIGIVIFDETWWGRGLGYHALGLWSEYLFLSLPDILRLDLRTWSGNAGMMRLAHKLGYREEARFRQARRVHGTLYDGLGYGILRSEWEEQFPHGFTVASNAKAGTE